VNVAAVIQVSPPSSSFPSLGTVAQTSVPNNPLGTFASLVDGLVAKGQSSLLGGLIQEAPADLLSSDGSHASSRLTGKHSRIGETGVGPTKRNELKPKAGLAQTAEMVQPLLVQAPVLFRALIWGNPPAASKTSGNEPQGDTGAQVAPEDLVTPITVTSPRTVASFPIENDPIPTSTLAFGLRLTPLYVEASPANRSLLESQRIAGLNITIAATDNAEANRLPSQVLAVSFLATHPGQPIARQSAPRGGNLSASELPSRTEQPSFAKSTNSIAFRGSGNDFANNPEGLAETLSAAGDLPARMELLHLSNGPVVPSAETKGTHPAPSGNDLSASQESNMDGSPRLGPVPTPSAPSGVRIAQFADPSILPDYSGSQRLISRNIGADTSAAGQPARVTGDAPSPKEVTSPKAQQRLVLESDERRSPITLRPENETESNRDQRTARAVSEQAGQPVTAGELDASKTRSAADGADVIKLQAAKSQTTTPQPITSQATTVQTARPQSTTSQNTIFEPAASKTTPAQAAASQTTPSGEVSHSATSSKTTADQATANTPITNQAMTNLASSQVTASPAATQSTTCQHSAAPPTSANEIEVNTGSQPQAARQISLKLTGEDATKVSVYVSERGGKVQIAVRSSDPELASSLRTDLSDLVGRLESRGFKTEAWVPTASRHTAAGAAEQPSSNNSSGHPRDSGSSANQRQGRPGQNGSNQRQQARWMAQLKETISKDETRIEAE